MVCAARTTRWLSIILPRILPQRQKGRRGQSRASRGEVPGEDRGVSEQNFKQHQRNRTVNMSACREGRKSEHHFNRIILAVRNMDKLLWLGSQYHLEDLREYAAGIKSDLDTVIEERVREIEAEDQRIKLQKERSESLDKPGTGKLSNLFGGQPQSPTPGL